MHIKKNENIKFKVGYQIFPISFKDSNNDGIGDLKGIEEKLPYLKELGIDIIWLCPIYKSNFADAGYDVINYCEIDPKFGTMEDFDSLMKNAKKLGIDIMMDFVINHASTDSFEFKQACLSRDNEYHDFFVWSDNPKLENESIFGNSAWEYVESVDRYYLHIFAKEQADFNFHSEKFKNWLYKIFIFWLEKGVKFFRFDAIEHIGKTVDPYIIRYGKYNHQFLEEIAKNVTSKYDCYVVGESWNVNPEIMRKYSIEDKIVDSFFNFSTLFFDWKNPNGAMAKIKNEVDWKDLEDYFKWQKENLITATSWTNHDVPRAIDRYFKTDINNRFYAQTAMTTLLMTTKGIPFIYQGEEFGMSPLAINSYDDFVDQQIFRKKEEFMKNNNYTDQEYFQANLTGSRDLSRSIMSWNDSKNAGFTNDNVKPYYKKSKDFETINAENDISKNKKSIFLYTKKLIDLRKNKYKDWFCDFDSIEIIVLDSKKTIYSLIKNKKNIYVSINWTNEEQKCKRDIKNILLSNYEDDKEKINNEILKPFEATIYE